MLEVQFDSNNFNQQLLKEGAALLPRCIDPEQKERLESMGFVFDESIGDENHCKVTLPDGWKAAPNEALRDVCNTFPTLELVDKTGKCRVRCPIDNTSKEKPFFDEFHILTSFEHGLVEKA